MDKIWRLSAREEAVEHRLTAEVGVTPLVAQLLAQRGITEPEAARRFLHPETEQRYHDPFLLLDMEKAVVRVEKAIAAGEEIAVYGDYDVDGITATTLLLRTLRRLGAKASYYIPVRQEGYGLHEEALRRLAKEGFSVVVTVDCGISAVEEVAMLRGSLDIVITDHHLPGTVLPPAVAVVNPHREGDTYPFSDLAGVGVAWKLCQALWQRLRGEEFTEDLELVALGTVADMVPLLDENRKLVREGLRCFSTTPLIGLAELIRSAGLDGQPITAGHIGFVLGPRLNAAGRLETAAKGVELLLSDDRAKAALLAEELNAANAERKAVEQDILAQAEEQIASTDKEKARFLVVAGEGWHHGVIGLVASRLTERYYRPSVVISLENGVGKGSCRSIPGCNIFDALAACGDTLLQFGGHAMAAGLSVAEGNVNALRDGLEKFAALHLTPEDYVPVLTAAAELNPAALTLDLLDEIALLEPFGVGNPRPLFFGQEVTAQSCRLMGEAKNHLRFSVGETRVVGWRMGEEAPFVEAGSIDIAYETEINVWHGERFPQCRLAALREAASRRIFPDRDTLARVYRALKALAEEGKLAMDERKVALRCGVSMYTFSCACRIFTELGLMQRTENGWRIPPPPRQKLSLEDSDTFMHGTLA
ncbi:MAG: single-stranded-DNA-specific exonuclease RecJ [Schwartzia sp. (in: firmicutes)]